MIFGTSGPHVTHRFFNNCGERKKALKTKWLPVNGKAFLNLRSGITKQRAGFLFHLFAMIAEGPFGNKKKIEIETP
jgi:hypothetical protein